MPRIFLSSLFFLLVGLPLSAQAKRSPACLHWKSWKRQLQARSLWLSATAYRAQIKRGNGKNRPLPTTETRRIIKRYKALLAFAKRQRSCLAKAYKRARSWRTRRHILRTSKSLVMKWLDRVILPLWIGTAWAFYGSAESPHQKSIACGYFVTHALLATGFRFPEHQRAPRHDDPTMREYEFAKQTSLGMMRLLSSRRRWKVRNYRHPTRYLLRTLKRFGKGIYLLGLDSHVGMVFWDGTRATFWHADFTPTRLWVHREPLLTAGVVVASRYRHLGKIRRHAYRKWLRSQPFLVSSLKRRNKRRSR